MSKTKRIVIAAVVVVVIAAGATVYALMNANKSAAPAAEQHDHAQDSVKTTDSTDIASTITYNGSSFSLSKSTITSGSNVKITNDSSDELDFDSDPHPTHTDNPELNAGSIAPGESKTITLTNKGSWGFHNHFDPTQHGTITVE